MPFARLRLSAFLFDFSDFLALIGFAAVEYGLWQVSPPATWMLGGLVLVALAVLWPEPRKVQ